MTNVETIKENIARIEKMLESPKLDPGVRKIAELKLKELQAQLSESTKVSAPAETAPAGPEKGKRGRKPKAEKTSDQEIFKMLDKSNYTFFSDPGHGWLRVPFSVLNYLEIENKITQFSYVSKDRKWAYLEEDLDAGTFINALQKKHGKMTNAFDHNDSNSDSFIRSLPRFPKLSETSDDKIEAEQKTKKAKSAKHTRAVKKAIKEVPQETLGKLRDGQRRALGIGKRISKDGNIYYEYRLDHADANRNKKGYTKGKYFAAGGEVSAQKEMLDFLDNYEPPFSYRDRGEPYVGNGKYYVLFVTTAKTMDYVDEHHKTLGNHFSKASEKMATPVHHLSISTKENENGSANVLYTVECGYRKSAGPKNHFASGGQLRSNKFYANIQTKDGLKYIVSSGNSYNLWGSEERLIPYRFIFTSDEQLKSAIDKIRSTYSTTPWFDKTAKFNKEALPQSVEFNYASGGQIQRATDEVKKYILNRIKQSGADMHMVRAIVSGLKADLMDGPDAVFGNDQYPGWHKGLEKIDDYLNEADLPDTLYYDMESGFIAESEPDGETTNPETGEIEYYESDWVEIDTKEALMGPVAQYMEKGGQVPEKDRSKVMVLAVKFSHDLRAELNPNEMLALNAMNIASNDPDVCASHDFIDSNQVMLDSFEAVMDRPVVFPDEDKTGGEGDFPLINAAWLQARKAWFYPSDAEKAKLQVFKNHLSKDGKTPDTEAMYEKLTAAAKNKAKGYWGESDIKKKSQTNTKLARGGKLSQSEIQDIAETALENYKPPFAISYTSEIDNEKSPNGSSSWIEFSTSQKPDNYDKLTTHFKTYLNSKYPKLFWRDAEIFGGDQDSEGDYYLTYSITWGTEDPTGRYKKGGQVKNALYPDLSKIVTPAINDSAVATTKKAKSTYMPEFSLETVDYKKIPQSEMVIWDANTVAQIFASIWDEKKIDMVEQSWALYLNKTNKPIGAMLVSQGGIDATIMDPEIIALGAVKCLAKGVVVAHNHPSGTVTPSKADIEITKKLVTGLDALSIVLLDHIIITSIKPREHEYQPKYETKFFSFAEEGMLPQPAKFAAGGAVDEKTEIHFKPSTPADDAKYKGITGDIDHDGLPNSDDPNPTKKGDKHSVEETQLAKGVDKLLKLRHTLDERTSKLTKELQKMMPNHATVYARVKAPISTLNKLIDKRLLDPKHPERGLTDIVGTTIATATKHRADEVAQRIKDGELGRVIEFEDMYKDPKLGYRAYHFIVDYDGIPVEIQVKTKRMKEINELSHTPYKLKNLNEDYMLYLTDLANKADTGDKTDREAEQSRLRFTRAMKNRKKTARKLYKNPPSDIPEYEQGGSVEGFIVPTIKQQLVGNAIAGDLF